MISWRSDCVTLTVTLRLYRGGAAASVTAVNDNSYLFYLASAANAEVLICKASSDWLKLCLLLSFCYLKLQYNLLTVSILE